MNYNQSLKYLNQFINYESRNIYKYNDETFSLRRFRYLLEQLGSPEKNLKIIHVAGSNGKGSVCAYLSSLSSDFGLKAGLFISPHLFDVRERIQLNGNLISKKDFSFIISKVALVIDKDKKEYPKIFSTYFEILLASALLYFQMKKTDVAILECGLGGRLDATNVVQSKISVITSISLEHTDKLGGTIAEIAFEKAGIIKKNTPIVCSVQNRQAFKVISNIAENLNAPFIIPREDFEKNGLSIKKNQYVMRICKLNSKNYIDINLPILGIKQPDNIMTAISAFCIFNKISIQDIVGKYSNKLKSGIENTKWFGRFQLIKYGAHSVILDIAHNPESASVLRKNINKYFPDKTVIFIFGSLLDKKPLKMLKSLIDCRDYLDIVPIKSPRAMSVEKISDIASKLDINYASFNNLEDAIRKAFQTSPKSIICVTGSLYLVGECMALLNFRPFLR